MRALRDGAWGLELGTLQIDADETYRDRTPVSRNNGRHSGATGREEVRSLRRHISELCYYLDNMLT